MLGLEVFCRGAEREGGLDVLAGHRGARDIGGAARGEPVDEDRELAPGDQRPAGAVRQRPLRVADADEFVRISAIRGTVTRKP